MNSASTLFSLFIRLDQVYGYKFNNLQLLRRAVTHVSKSDQLNFDNERLELLGDEVINMVVSECLYKSFPTASEGQLSKVRAFVVGRVVLSAIAKEMDLDNLLLRQHNMKLSHHTNCSTLEAIIGAVYEDSNFNMSVCRKLVAKIFDIHLSSVLTQYDVYDYKSFIQSKVALPEYHIIDSSGPEHKKVFSVSLTFNSPTSNEIEVITQSAQTIKEAEQKCAKEACRLMKLDIQEFYFGYDIKLNVCFRITT